MEAAKKAGRYDRLYQQLAELMKKSNDPSARMSSVAAVLHHKMPGFFWTGFYLLTDDGRLVVRTYQGPVACMELKKGAGVCWAGINQQKTIVVPDVEQFPGHIACDSRSKSEIVVPVKDSHGNVIGVLDVDSDKLNTFDQTDAESLERIVSLIFN
ncbi:MAG TPA: histidine kinase [Marinilabiliales bacterium]|jgi:GAF domain-containing protein|nr:MAG: histidine kinase [Bacteroidetes bacterium GWC2_40_13]OFX74786.1 MAG: histidine kinase [Bacteroidetes bacterium GWD2_40_43]OFX91971.1 MAG: histidine kinase [Bacteroidetes bacterium GWE2_40_63]OFY24612.1 MAG: histidine kinase [Bacteroidetes bacterium GWF2_40_13]OFZ26854.1 MAG: histidine kinase [Bacteroidetes bacterium RIFOXYC2_FULL_40_12]HAN00355.1 histidine kinase [Marinilabiliales bacterium]